MGNAMQRQKKRSERRCKMSKYKAVRTVVDGITFASKKEAARYCELKLLQKSGLISDLRMQVPYEIIPKCGSNRAVKYIADFVYNENGDMVVEDCKGMKTQVYIIKKKLMRWRYGIEIKEV